MFINPLIVALDLSDAETLRTFCYQLGKIAGGLKIGKEAFTALGPRAVEIAQRSGAAVFLDLKYHDIPNTVAHACRNATFMRVAMLTVHALGGKTMMRKAVDATIDTAEQLNIPRPLIVAVTVLTSHDQTSLREIGIADSINDEVVRLAALAKASGVDGVVASPQEVSTIRNAIGDDFVIVTPGIRPNQASRAVMSDDQKRTADPASVMAQGASYLVVGRPVTQASDPTAACRSILDDMRPH